MIVVLAHGDDDQAVSLVTAWRSDGAVLVTPQDLSTPGWVVTHPVAHPGAGGSFVAEGRRHRTDSIVGALVRLAGVDPAELFRVADADRAYAAAEMTALLAHWLESLPARVVNRPSPAFLLGPGWSTEEWLTRAARLGLPVRVLARVPTIRPERLAPLGWATVVGRGVFGEAGGPELHEGLLALAEAAGVEFLSAGFVDADRCPRLAQVSLTPALSDAGVAEALLDLLLGRAVGCPSR